VATTLQPTDRVGPYTLVEKIGAGSMGEVWRALGGPRGAEPPANGAAPADGGAPVEVALKIPRRPAFIRHLKREGVLLARVDHPRVSKFVACDTEAEVPYLATELVKGKSLRTLCDGRIASDKATLLCDQILDGLEAIHRAGILHLDLKPENVLVQEDGSLKIVDLGLGKATSAFMAELYLSASLASRDIPLAGTLAYMAPEQRKGKKVDARADLFAFGVVLHELLSGKIPGPEVRLSRLRTDLVPRWDVVVARLTHPDLGQRPKTAAEARQLIAFTLHEKAVAPVTGTGGKARDLATFDEDALAYESPWAVGMKVGDCELEAPLGRGGFGEVWRAKRVREEGEEGKVETVALKLAIREEARPALGKEAALAKRVDHPGVPKVLDDRSAEEPPHVVFELVAGTSLRALINEDGLIPLEAALEMMKNVLEVVKACHRAGVIHRDLKPEHFLVSEDGKKVSLIDFGLAALVGRDATDASLATGDARGTFDYMAPEQRAGRDVGPAADVYALGVTFFEMLADELPRGPQSLKQLRREVPDEIDRVVLQMLSESPYGRPALDQVLHALGVSPISVGPRRDRISYTTALFGLPPVPVACAVVAFTLISIGAAGTPGEKILFGFVAAATAFCVTALAYREP